jgi:hypothetical protein
MLRSTIHHRGAPAAAAVAPPNARGATFLFPTSNNRSSIAASRTRATSSATATVATINNSIDIITNSRRDLLRRHHRLLNINTNTNATAADGRDVPAVPAAAFSPVSSPDQLRADADHIGGAIAQWLDEEWTPLPEHTALGRAVADAYVRLRTTGDRAADDDVASVLLGLGSDLMTSFDFNPTFTNGFEVANKAIELAMRRDGMEVCDCSGGGGGGPSQQ